MSKHPETYGWKNTGKTRPAFADEPKEGQESVWDYPRPPAVIEETRTIKIAVNGATLANTTRALKVCETASPPTYYIPMQDVVVDDLIPLSHSTYCEWKGQSSYFAHVSRPDMVIAWTYRTPKPAFAQLRDHLCVYASKADCTLGSEVVRAQSSDFYGGWITSDIAGPFKGDPGTSGW